jgi:hypothetical protein
MPSQWDRFLPPLGHIPGQIGKVAYGVISNSDEAGSYEYICGVEVSEFPCHPPEFTRLRIPPQPHAVFEHRDHISAIGATWKAIWTRLCLIPVTKLRMGRCSSVTLNSLMAGRVSAAWSVEALRRRTRI